MKTWDKIAKGWYHLRQQPVSEVKNFKAGKTILDIGCGNCRNLLPFRQKFLVGMDSSIEMLKTAKQFCKKHKLKVHLVLAEAEALPFHTNSFHTTLSIASLHHCRRRKQAVKELARVTRTNGEAIVSVWYNPKSGARYVPWKHKEKTIKRYYYFFRKSELQKLLKDVGFSITKSKQDKNIVFWLKK
jgi:ubiquinone/menaquinone biosynthesis C-methylase UbiE